MNVKRKLALSLLAGGMLAMAPFASPAAKQPNEQALRAFMRAKLDAAEDVLEGLVIEDFEKIEQGAQRMRVMSARAEWNVIKTPEYDQYSNEFRHAAKRLEKSAKQENLDEAALTYVGLTVTCVNCHKHTRGAKIAALPLPETVRGSVASRRRSTLPDSDPEADASGSPVPGKASSVQNRTRGRNKGITR